jgi:hypothetical protein
MQRHGKHGRNNHFAPAGACPADPCGAGGVDERREIKYEEFSRLIVGSASH